MLYDYLKEHGGICASHTSATGMGTDWRDMNPEVEPFVEIYQGHRESYEHLGAPRAARRPGESIGGWQPLGMVWNALAMQYRLGFQASSDHISTHISYAVALAEDTTRAAILDAFRRRHCYAATDNIILDVRSGEHLMGDEFDADGPVKLKVLVHGTRPMARVDIIKDFRYVYSTEPGRAQVEFAVDRRRSGPPARAELVLRPRHPGRRRARLGQPHLGAYPLSLAAAASKLRQSTVGQTRMPLLLPLDRIGTALMMSVPILSPGLSMRRTRVFPGQSGLSVLHVDWPRLPARKRCRTLRLRGRDSHRRPAAARYQVEALEGRATLSATAVSPGALASSTTVLIDSSPTAVTGSRIIFTATVDSASNDLPITAGTVKFVAESPQQTVLGTDSLDKQGQASIATSAFTKIGNYQVERSSLRPIPTLPIASQLPSQ